MSTSKFIESLRIFNRSQAKNRRTVVPGQIGNVTREDGREQDADFVAGIPELVAGEADPGTPSPDAPRLNLAGGGFYFLMPVKKGDECIGLVSDRAIDEWRQSREPGLVPVFERVQDDSDVLTAPLSITAPSGAPDTWTGPVIGGPDGPAFELEEGGAMTLTKQGAPVATISMEQGGTITLEVATGQSVNVGGPAAVALTKIQQLLTVLTNASNAAIAAAPIPPAIDNGSAAFGAFLGVLQGTLVNAAGTAKAKGE